MPTASKGGIATAAWIAIAAVPAAAQLADQTADHLIASLGQQSAKQVALGDAARANIARKRAIDTQYAALAVETTQLNAAVVKATAYCAGAYSAPEYARRKAACDYRQAEFDRQRESISRKRATVDAEDAARLKNAKALQLAYAAQQRDLKSIEDALVSDPALASVWVTCPGPALQARAKCLSERWSAASASAAKAEQTEFDRMNAAWLHRQQDQIRAAAAQNARWRHEMLSSIEQIRVPAPDLQPRTLVDVQPGDVLLLVPERGFSPTRLIPPADWLYRVAEHWASGETFREAIHTPEAPVSHAVTVAKSVDGRLLFLDHTIIGSRILTKPQFEQKYGMRGMFMARPSEAVDGRLLWQAVRDAALKRKSDYGFVGGNVVCSQRAGLAVAKATGISMNNHRFGPIDITPGDFFDEQSNGKYFVIMPIAH